jgi:hypothetical protein
MIQCVAFFFLIIIFKHYFFLIYFFLRGGLVLSGIPMITMFDGTSARRGDILIPLEAGGTAPVPCLCNTVAIPSLRLLDPPI